LISRLAHNVAPRFLAGSLLLAFALVGGGGAGCRHPEDHGHDTAPLDSASVATPIPSAPAPAPQPERAAAPDPGPIEDPGPPVPAEEARRSVLRRMADDRALSPHEAVLRDHFGNPISFPLDVQSAPLSGGGRALLFQRGGKDHNPFILVHDAAGQPLWIKERPLAGIVPGVTEMVLVAAAKGDVVLSWYDAPTKIVAARHWDAHGSILVDFPLLHAGACAALAGIHWPRQGFVVAASTAGAARVQLLSDAGTLAFGGEEGLELPWTSRADAPVSIAVDGSKGVTFFQVGHAGAGQPGAPPDHLLAARFDARGKALWDRSLVVGPVPGAVTDRVVLTMGNEGNVVISRLGVMVTPAGSVVTVARGKH
jgi:hypothetical protein